MNLVDKVIEEQLHRDHRRTSDTAKVEEEKRAEELNALPLEEFHELPREDQEFAEELWTAKVLEANVRREAERQDRLLRELELTD